MINLKYNIAEKKLQILIDELADEYKEFLIETTLEKTHEIDIDRIPASKLVETDAEIKTHLKNFKSNSRNNKIFMVVSFLCLLYISLGLVILIFSRIDSYYLNDPTKRVAFLLIFIGILAFILTCLIKYFFLLKPSKNRKNSNLTDYLVISKWKMLEGLLYQLTPPDTNMSIRTMLNYLCTSNLLTKEEYRIILSFLELRNSCVHQKNTSFYNDVKIHSLLEDVDVILNKLKKYCK